jgi:hypothetical protein
MPQEILSYVSSQGFCHVYIYLFVHSFIHSFLDQDNKDLFPDPFLFPSYYLQGLIK